MIVLNIFQMKAACTRREKAEGTISAVEADKKLKVYDFLATSDMDDLYRIFNTGILNEIVMCYVWVSVSDLVDLAVINRNQASAVISRIYTTVEEKTCKEVMNYRQ